MRALIVMVSAAALVAACAGGRGARPAASGGGGETATATLSNAGGERVGEVQLRQAPGGVIARVTLDGVPAGEHAFHVHEVGRCEPPFETAGGHYAPRGRAHGIENPDGKHAGDLPNLQVPATRMLDVTFFLEAVSLRGEDPLLDADGSAFVVHERADDYRTDPAGDAGARIACGVVAPR
jgi:Cu-Zn family superoxide dismutase